MVQSGNVNLSGQDNGDIALLGGCCLFLSAVDYLIPKPLPFMRIGLANLPLLLALASPASKIPDGERRAGNNPLLFSLRSYWLLVLIKVSGQALITGTLFSYVFFFSLAGTAASAVCMYLLRRIPGPRFISLTGTGIAGAFVSNGAQFILARFLIFGESARYLAPPFLAAGIISGGILGLFAEGFAGKSKWVRKRGKRREEGKGAILPDAESGNSSTEMPGRGTTTAGTAGLFRLCAGLGAAGLFLLVPWLPVRTALFLLFWIAVIVLRKETRLVLTLFVIVAVTAFNLFPPYGKVLAVFGPITITLGSLLGGLRKAISFEGLIMLSRLIVHNGLQLPGSFGRLLGDSFAVLEKLNGRKSALETAADKGDMGDTGKCGLMEKLDRFLCELSSGQAC
jgi:heptaprenyl diphosphate synthase